MEMMEAVSLEKCLPLQPFIFAAGTTLHQDRDMETVTSLSWGKAWECHPRGWHLPGQWERTGAGWDRAVHCQRGSEPANTCCSPNSSLKAHRTGGSYQPRIWSLRHLPSSLWLIISPQAISQSPLTCSCACFHAQGHCWNACIENRCLFQNHSSNVFNFFFD